MTNEKEEWRPIEMEGYENLYAVSSLGRVKRLERIRSSGIPLHEMVLRLETTRLGYVRVAMTGHNGKPRHFLVHRLVATAFLPNPNNYEVVDHLDGNRANNRVSNLDWTSQSENCRRAFRNGRRPCKTALGKPSHQRKLTQEDVEAIKRDDRLQHEIAADYGVHKSTISNIKRGKYYNIPEERRSR